MRKYHLAAFFIIWFFSEKSLLCQDQNLEKVYTELKERGEMYFAFYADKNSLNHLSKIISIDDYINDTVYAYANKIQFEKFKELNIPFAQLIPPSLQIKHFQKKTTVAEDWDYPSYDAYLQKMEKFSSENPSLCKLIEFGTSVKGKKLLAIKISDNAGSEEDEPEIFYTAGIHGDEGTGVVLMLKLIDYLISNYDKNEVITNLVENSQIYINPLSNPDGFYFLNDTSNYGATRFNNQNIDLNRNFPDPEEGDHPDGNQWQIETVAMMNFMREHNFILSANFHDGTEVVNYPWDTWEKLHADNDWFIFISRAYADTVQKYSDNENYFTYLNKGVTNGYQWYEVAGGRQDYVTYFLNGREVTIELSDTKSPDSQQLKLLWNYNKNSLVNYLLNCLKGIKGYVKDSNTGIPLRASISVLNHDIDNSNVFSLHQSGVFYRMIFPGNYTISVNSEGYLPEVIDVSVLVSGQITVNVDLESSQNVNKEVTLINPAGDNLQIIFPVSLNEMIKAEIFDLSGRLVDNTIYNSNGYNTILINTTFINSGFYILRIKSETLSKEFKFIKE